MDLAHLQIEEVLPHRGSMLLLERVLTFSPECIAVGARPQLSAWYAEKDGMPSWIGIELMAQAIAAHVGMCCRGEGCPVRPGVLLGTRKYRCSVGHFPFGAALTVRAAPSFRDASGVAAYDAAIDLDGAEVASATLTVYEPENFAEFLRKSGNPA